MVNVTVQLSDNVIADRCVMLLHNVLITFHNYMYIYQLSALLSLALSHNVNNIKCSCSCCENRIKHAVRSHGLRLSASTRSLKSSKVGADTTLAGRPFQRRAVGGNNDTDAVAEEEKTV